MNKVQYFLVSLIDLISYKDHFIVLEEKSGTAEFKEKNFLFNLTS